MPCYLITGGAGFFGTILKQHFLAKGAHCVSIDLEPDSFSHPHFTAYQGDINDTTLMEHIFSTHKFDAVFHCAALLAHVKKDLKRLWQANVCGTQSVYDFALKYNVRKIVFISSNCLWAKISIRPLPKKKCPNRSRYMANPNSPPSRFSSHTPIKSTVSSFALPP